MQPDLATQPDQGLYGAARALAERYHLPTTLIKFLMVGGLGFLINQFMLFLLYDSPVFFFLPDKDTELSLGLFAHPDIRLLIASITAVEVAIIVQFKSHEAWTFRNRQRSGLGIVRFLKFNLSSAVSPIIIVLCVNILTPVFGISPYISNAIGVLLGFSWNWSMNSLIIWPHHRQASAKAE